MSLMIKNTALKIARARNSKRRPAKAKANKLVTYQDSVELTIQKLICRKISKKKKKKTHTARVMEDFFQMKPFPTEGDYSGPSQRCQSASSEVNAASLCLKNLIKKETFLAKEYFLLIHTVVPLFPSSSLHMKS